MKLSWSNFASVIPMWVVIIETDDVDATGSYIRPVAKKLSPEK